MNFFRTQKDTYTKQSKVVESCGSKNKLANRPVIFAARSKSSTVLQLGNYPVPRASEMQPTTLTKHSNCKTFGIPLECIVETGGTGKVKRSPEARDVDRVTVPAAKLTQLRGGAGFSGSSMIDRINRCSTGNLAVE